jgi:hypothetical protein
VSKIAGFKMKGMPKSKLTMAKAMKAPRRSHGKKMPTLKSIRVPKGGLLSPSLRK